MATRLYLRGNSTPVYTPATFRGSWDKTTSTEVACLEHYTTLASPTDTHNNAEAVSTADYDVVVTRFVSQPLPNDVTIAGTLQICLGMYESNAAADFYPHIHAFVTQGDTDNVRGTLLDNFIAATELGTNSGVSGIDFGAQAIGSVDALKYDRIVIEVGYQSKNISTTSYTATIMWSSGFASDLAAGGNPGAANSWAEFSTTLLVDDASARVTAVDAEVDITNTAPYRRVTAVGAEVDIAILTEPIITGVVPASGEVGDTLTISGINFGAVQGTSTIVIGGVTATPTSWSDTEIVVDIPIGAVTGTIVITTTLGTDSIAITVTVSTPVTPPSTIDPNAWPNYPVYRVYLVTGATPVPASRIIKCKVIGSGDASAFRGTPILKAIDIGTGPQTDYPGQEQARVYIIGTGSDDAYAGFETVRLFTVE